MFPQSKTRYGISDCVYINSNAWNIGAVETGRGKQMKIKIEKVAEIDAKELRIHCFMLILSPNLTPLYCPITY